MGTDVFFSNNPSLGGLYAELKSDWQFSTSKAKLKYFKIIIQTIILHDVQPVIDSYYSNTIRVELCLNFILNDTFIWVIIGQTVALSYNPSVLSS